MGTDSPLSKLEQIRALGQSEVARRYVEVEKPQSKRPRPVEKPVRARPKRRK